MEEQNTSTNAGPEELVSTDQDNNNCTSASSVKSASKDCTQEAENADSPVNLDGVQNIHDSKTTTDIDEETNNDLRASGASNSKDEDDAQTSTDEKQTDNSSTTQTNKDVITCSSESERQSDVKKFPDELETPLFTDTYVYKKDQEDTSVRPKEPGNGKLKRDESSKSKKSSDAEWHPLKRNSGSSDDEDWTPVPKDNAATSSEKEKADPCYTYTYSKFKSEEAKIDAVKMQVKEMKKAYVKRATQKKEPFDPDEIFKGDISSELTDMGTYSYITLCAVCLHHLYDNAAPDKKFVAKLIEHLGAHLKVNKSVLESAQVVARGDGLHNTEPFVAALKEEKLIKKYGAEVVLQSTVGAILKQGTYDARARVMLRSLARHLCVQWYRVEDYEDFVVESFMEEEHNMTEEEKKEREDQEKKRKIKKYALIGASTVIGGTLIGLTGGLAAPFIAAGAGAVIGGAGAAALGSVAGIYIIGSLFGVAGAGLAGYKMNKRVGDLEEFEFEPLTEGRQLHLTIAVSGWLTEESPGFLKTLLKYPKEDFKYTWRTLSNSQEQYVLRYESRFLVQIGSSMDYIVNMAVSQATKEALKYTVLSSLMAAVMWPATLLSAASIIDNSWSVAMNRSAQAGKQLAEVLLSRHQGKRPVTLIGFSLGARVIFYCLQEMAERKNCEGIVENVYLLGAPVTGSVKEWKKLSRVVAGTITNGYCGCDWLLKFLYRTASVQMSIAGLAPVPWEDRRMQNIDLTAVVEGHNDYMAKIDDVLDIIGIDTKPYISRDNTKESLKELCKLQKSTKAHHHPGVNGPPSRSTSQGSLGGERRPVNKLPVSGETYKDRHGDKIVTGCSLEYGNLEVAEDALFENIKTEDAVLDVRLKEANEKTEVKEEKDTNLQSIDDNISSVPSEADN